MYCCTFVIARYTFLWVFLWFYYYCFIDREESGGNGTVAVDEWNVWSILFDFATRLNLMVGAFLSTMGKFSN